MNDKTEKCGITLPISLVKQVDKTRGDIPRSMFIRRIEELLAFHAAVIKRAEIEGPMGAAPYAS